MTANVGGAINPAEKSKRVSARAGFSAAGDLKAAAEEACASFANSDPKLILIYSDVLRFRESARLISEKFPHAVVAGCTTYASLSPAGEMKNGLLAMAFIDGISCRAGIIKQITHNPMKYADQVAEAASSLGELSNTICLLLTPAKKKCEELVLDAIAQKLRDRSVPVFGGSASMADDDRKSYVALNGCIYDDCSVFVLLRSDCGRIGLYRENIFKPTRHIFTVTDSDVPSRTIYTLDDKPIAEVLSKALGVQKQELPKVLPDHPLGRIVGDNIYITEHLGATPDGGMSFYARAYNQTRIALLEPDDFKRVFNETVSRIKRDIPSPSFSLVINCVSRSKMYERGGIMDEFMHDLTKELGPFAGYCAFGEQLGYAHFNQTMLVAVFE